MPTERLTVLVLIASFLMAPSTGHAYVLKQAVDGSTVAWLRTEVTFCVAEPGPGVSLDRATVEEAMRVAASAWSEVPGVPEVLVDDAPCGAADALDSVNTVMVLGEWNEPHLAVTRSSYGASGSLIEADILIDGTAELDMLEEDDAGPRYDLASVLTHEVGHALGLDESDVPGSVMWPTVGRGRSGGRELTTDDVDGVRAIYGHRAEDAILTYGCAAAPGRSRDGAAGLLFAIAFALLYRRRR